MMYDLTEALSTIGVWFLVLLIIAMLAGFPVMLLWNAVVPTLGVGLVKIGFWQAVGLNVLCSCLFKSPSSSS